jgi:hypothetical protein
MDGHQHPAFAVHIPIGSDSEYKIDPRLCPSPYPLSSYHDEKVLEGTRGHEGELYDEEDEGNPKGAALYFPSLTFITGARSRLPSSIRLPPTPIRPNTKAGSLQS